MLKPFDVVFEGPPIKNLQNSKEELQQSIRVQAVAQNCVEALSALKST
jgi:hypothetical protein